MAKKVRQPQQRIPKVAKPKTVPMQQQMMLGMNSTKKRVLNIGWNSATTQALHPRFRTEEWQEIRLDQEAAAKPNIIAPLKDMKGVPEGSMDAVWAQHVLQRFSPPDMLQIVRECFRVLKPMGHFFLSVPDGQSAAAYVATGHMDQTLFQTPAGAVTPMDLLYGFRGHLQRGWEHQAHRGLFTGEFLGIVLRDQGFTNIRIHRRASFDLLAIGYKYPYDHPERAEKIEVVQDANPSAPKVDKAALPAALPQTAPMAQLKGRRGLSDELDIPPAQYKPLGLGKK